MFLEFMIDVCAILKIESMRCERIHVIATKNVHRYCEQMLVKKSTFFAQFKSISLMIKRAFNS